MGRKRLTEKERKLNAVMRIVLSEPFNDLSSLEQILYLLKNKPEDYWIRCLEIIAQYEDGEQTSTNAYDRMIVGMMYAVSSLDEMERLFGSITVDTAYNRVD